MTSQTATQSGAARRRVPRRAFLRQTATATATAILSPALFAASKARPAVVPAATSLETTVLPQGSAPDPVALPHFPDRLHAYVWRNWPLVPLDRLAAVVGARPYDLRRMAAMMGLGAPPRITADQQRRSYLTVIRRNWHLLPYEQLLELLDWTAEQMAFTLREDDFLFIKLGGLKPRCERLRYAPPDAKTREREHEMAKVVQEELVLKHGSAHELALTRPVATLSHRMGEGRSEGLSAFTVRDGRSQTGDHAGLDPLGSSGTAPSRGDRRSTQGTRPPEGGTTNGLDAADPLFGFVQRLSQPPRGVGSPGFSRSGAAASPRFCYSYFALYGDPLLERNADPYPDGYLARLADVGVNGVWLQAVLYQLAPFPWDARLSARHPERLRNLRTLVVRARKHGIGVYLYLNEPRAMPLGFFANQPGLKGAIEGDHAALCTSAPAVQRYLVNAAATICRAVPDLAGFFTITGSENLTNCWSHGGGARCPRCGKRSPAEVIAEVNGLFRQGIRQAGARTRLIVWDWGWADDWVEKIIARLPADVALMSVSEWGIPIERGGVATTVGEYSISTIGPGPRATRHWDWARRRGLRTIAKIQAGNTWELSAVPYIPALENVAQHAVNLRAASVDGLMLGWTLGGYPSPNLEVVAEIAGDEHLTPEAAMERVARRRFGGVLAPAVVRGWRALSTAFREFPFHGGLVYNAPMQFGPSNLLWGEPTGYHATMIGFPYDDLDGWRAVYPVDVFIGQFEKVADGFERAVAELKNVVTGSAAHLRPSERQAVAEELNVAEAAAVHFRSTANQARFVQARRELAQATARDVAAPLVEALEKTARDELNLAQRLHAIQARDSRIGFEASNQYYYVPVDLAEKVLNCRDLLDRWLPAQREKWRFRTAALSRTESR